jgi:hypothetical protein
MITGPYTTLERELLNLFEGLNRRRPMRVRVAVLSRFHGFTDLQILELMEAWDESYGQPLALDYVSLVENRVSREWAGYVRDRIHQAQVRRFRQVSAEAIAETPTLTERIHSVLERERTRPSLPVSRHLLHNFDSRNADQRNAIGRLLLFVTHQPQTIRIPNSRVSLQPGRQYAWAENRWLLGRAYGPGGSVLVWLDGDIDGQILTTALSSFHEDLGRGIARAGRSAAIWVPVGRAIGLACAVSLLPLALPAVAPVAAESGLATAAQGIGWALRMSRISWFFTGHRLIAGSTNAALNIITQALDHGFNLERYNWGSVGADYVFGAISYAFARQVCIRWPTTGSLRHLSTWRNLRTQQAVLFVYGTIVGALRAHIGRTPRMETVSSQYAEGTCQALKNIAIQQFVGSPRGRQMFPGGYRQASADPRVIVISRLLTFIIRLAIRHVFDVTPRSEEAEARAAG